MNSSIELYAGTKALEKIKSNGINQQDFEVIAGAAGGPKWFILFGLDCYLFGSFFKGRRNPIHAIGSSAGAWRMACFAQNDPVDAINRLAHYYVRQNYSKKPDKNEITDKAIEMLDKVLSINGKNEIAENTIVQNHFITVRTKGLNQSENNFIQSLGLLSAAKSNFFKRQNLIKHFERVVFYAQNKTFSRPFFNFNDGVNQLNHHTQYYPLTEENIKPALMASGSMPLILRGVKNIPEAAQGIYRDGAIIDYHLDINFNTEKLVLYPHFSSTLKPGWFDKGLKKRKVNVKNYKNVLLVTPSQEFIHSLPYKKIPDRTDFKKLDEKERLKYWQQVIDMSHKMAEDFAKFINNPDSQQIYPIQQIL